MDLTSAGTWAVLYLISEWVIRIAMLIVVPFRRSPEAAKGWLLLVFFLPWPALVLYCVIGQPTFPRWRRERFARLPSVFEPVRQRLARSPHFFRPELPPALAQAATLVENLGPFLSRGGNHVELLSDYDGAIDRLVADIDAARETKTPPVVSDRRGSAMPFWECLTAVTSSSAPSLFHSSRA